jgi:hypothetical protein
MRPSAILLPLALLIAASSLLPGCGGGGNAVRVSGRLVKGGAKYTPPEGQRLTITLYSIESKDENGKDIKNEPYLATIDPDGESFTVPGKDGYGIPPGKYRIAIIQKMTREALEAAKNPVHAGKKVERETDLLDNQFSPDKSPIVRDIEGSKRLLIDLDKPTEG